MKPLGKIALWLAVLLLVGRFAGAEPPWNDMTPVADRQEDREVGGQVDSGRAQHIVKLDPKKLASNASKFGFTSVKLEHICFGAADEVIAKDAKGGNEE